MDTTLHPTPHSAMCPECQQGKHGNCDGTAWDNHQDEPAPCACAAAGHPNWNVSN